MLPLYQVSVKSTKMLLNSPFNRSLDSKMLPVECMKYNAPMMVIYKLRSATKNKFLGRFHGSMDRSVILQFYETLRNPADEMS